MEEFKPMDEKAVNKYNEQIVKDRAEMRRLEKEESLALYSEQRTVTYDPKTGQLITIKTRRK